MGLRPVKDFAAQTNLINSFVQPVAHTDNHRIPGWLLSGFKSYWREPADVEVGSHNEWSLPVVNR